MSVNYSVNPLFSPGCCTKKPLCWETVDLDCSNQVYFMVWTGHPLFNCLGWSYGPSEFPTPQMSYGMKCFPQLRILLESGIMEWCASEEKEKEWRSHLYQFNQDLVANACHYMHWNAIFDPYHFQKFSHVAIFLSLLIMIKSSVLSSVLMHLAAKDWFFRCQTAVAFNFRPR